MRQKSSPEFLSFVAPIYVGTRLSDVSVIVDVNSTVNDRAQFVTGCATVTIGDIDVVKPEGQYRYIFME